MMSQIEIWEMQKCCAAAEEQRRRRHRGFSPQRLIVLIAGVMLMAMSACLAAYLIKATIAMTGADFLAVAIFGEAAGITAVLAAILLR